MELLNNIIVFAYITGSNQLTFLNICCCCITIIIVIAFILVFIWFKDGNILGYAEGALPFYNISRYFDQTAYAWTEHPGLGSFASITTAGKPTYGLLTFIQQRGIPGYIIQAGVFWFFLISSNLDKSGVNKGLKNKIVLAEHAPEKIKNLDIKCNKCKF